MPYKYLYYLDKAHNIHQSDTQAVLSCTRLIVHHAIIFNNDDDIVGGTYVTVSGVWIYTIDIQNVKRWIGNHHPEARLLTEEEFNNEVFLFSI